MQSSALQQLVSVAVWSNVAGWVRGRLAPPSLLGASSSVGERQGSGVAAGAMNRRTDEAGRMRSIRVLQSMVSVASYAGSDLKPVVQQGKHTRARPVRASPCVLYKP